MRRLDWVSLLLLLIAVAIGVFIFTGYRSLSRTVEVQRAEIRQQQLAIQRSHRRLASVQADQLYMQDAIYGMTDFLELDLLRRLCEAQPDNTYAQRLCRYQNEFQPLIRLFNAATRSRTAMPKDYQATRQNYQALAQYLRAQESSSFRNEWLAIALEGIAYSQLKLNQPREASATISEAASLDPSSALVGITALKLRCVQGADTGTVRSEFSDLGRRLDQMMARTSRLPPDNIERRNARLERQLLEQDSELYLLCDYANLPAPRPPA